MAAEVAVNDPNIEALQEIEASSNNPNIKYQWVSEVIAFSSQYNDTTWSANQVIGTPKVYPNYGDLNGAWGQASGHLTNSEFIEVEFDEEVYVNEIHIFETYHCGGIINIKLKDKSANEWKSVWVSENGPVNLETSRVFKPPLKKTVFKTNQVRLEMDCTLANSYCEIDAIRLIGKIFLIEKVESEKTLSLNFKNLLESEEFCDVKFEIDGKLIKGHRNIFAARSAFFKNILLDNIKMDKMTRPLHLDNITYDGFRCLMYYIYTDRLDDQITTGDLCCELIRISKWYNLDGLENCCYLFIKEKLGLSNVIPIFVCATKLEPKIEGVQRICLKFIAKNFNQVITQPEFKTLDTDLLVKITQFYGQFIK